ncbi:MAG: DUF3362 domain-containing protein, partial [Clostridia bacterium]|nr:DUF3362 domain-containing protein [Clostridia bacterium]
TASTVMYYTGINPLDGKKVYVATDYHEKQLQRALLQWNRPQNYDLVVEALKKCGRTDLIGYGADCLIKPRKAASPQKRFDSKKPQQKYNKKSRNKKGR